MNKFFISYLYSLNNGSRKKSYFLNWSAIRALTPPSFESPKDLCQLTILPFINSSLGGCFTFIWRFMMAILYNFCIHSGVQQQKSGSILCLFAFPDHKFIFTIFYLYSPRIKHILIFSCFVKVCHTNKTLLVVKESLYCNLYGEQQQKMWLRR